MTHDTRAHTQEHTPQTTRPTLTWDSSSNSSTSCLFSTKPAPHQPVPLKTTTPHHTTTHQTTPPLKSTPLKSTPLKRTPHHPPNSTHAMQAPLPLSAHCTTTPALPSPQNVHHHLSAALCSNSNHNTTNNHNNSTHNSASINHNNHSNNDNNNTNSTKLSRGSPTEAALSLVHSQRLQPWSNSISSQSRQPTHHTQHDTRRHRTHRAMQLWSRGTFLRTTKQMVVLRRRTMSYCLHLVV